MNAAATEPVEALAEDSTVYIVRRVDRPPDPGEGWDEEAWRGVPSTPVAHFRPESSAHRPRTRVKLVFDTEVLCGLFRVEDRFIRCVHTGYQAPVYKDSCVEFFVQPRPDRGYFNLEFNCGGALLASYITDPRRRAEGFAAWQPLTADEGRRIAVRSSLPPLVDPEVREARTWQLAFRIPLNVLERYAGSLSMTAGAIWRANFYKCGDETSHPHWAAWQPVDALNFHLPHCFGRLRFEE